MEGNQHQSNLVSVPKTKRGVETLEKICRSAEHLFGSKGYNNTSINDITAGAEIAPGTFYIYFKDKLSIFKYLIQTLNHSLRKELFESIRSCNNRFEEEQEGFKAFFSFLNRHRGLYKIIWEAQFVDPEAFRDYYESIARTYSTRIKTAQKSGEIRPDADPLAVAYSFIGIANFIGLKWLIFDDKPVPEDIITDLMKIIKSGAFLRD